MDDASFQRILDSVAGLEAAVNQISLRINAIEKQLTRTETTPRLRSITAVATSQQPADLSRSQSVEHLRNAQETTEDLAQNEDATPPRKVNAPVSDPRAGGLSFRGGGWGDEQAERILRAKLISLYPVELWRYLKPLDDSLATVIGQLSRIETFLSSSSCAKPAAGNPHAPVSPRPLTTTPRKASRSRHTTMTIPDNVQPVFGRPSTLSRRFVSFDVTRSPFAAYSDEKSPFSQLVKGGASVLGQTQPPDS